MKKRNRGRPAKHPQLVVLQRRAHEHLKFEDLENNQNEIYISIREGMPAKGCNFSHFAKPNEDAWVVKFSFSGQQYTIATLKLYDACCLYDCLLVWFEEFRRQRPGADIEHPDAWFNFDRAAAEYHIESNEFLIALLSDLQKFFESLGVLKTAQQRADEQKEKAKERKAPNSLRGILNSGITDILNQLDTIERKLNAITK